jgi:phospholipid transport system substrate-binding protein
MLKCLLLSAALSLSAVAAQAAAAPVVAAPASAPDQIVRDTTEHMRELIRKNHDLYAVHQDEFYKIVDEVLVPRFDVHAITQSVLGRNSRAASDDQKKRFTGAFKLMLIRSYADTLLANYDSVKTDWQPLRLAPEASDATVHATLYRSAGQPVQLGFSMHKVDAEWRVYDVTVEAISLVANFRSQINAEIKRTSLDDLIVRMEKGESFKPSTQASGGS